MVLALLAATSLQRFDLNLNSFFRRQRRKFIQTRRQTEDDGIKIQILKAGTHMPAPCPTRESAVFWPSYVEGIEVQYSICKFRYVRTDTRPSCPHRARTVTDFWSFNFDGHGAVYDGRSVMDIEQLSKK
ncbi:hypothetical protein J6590_078505 [Homalodisca vitripennis]|nr:hypothetical protein J6590_078505 [Homalodisca vitripennis]